MQAIVPFLWFVDNVEEALDFYVSVFKDAKVNQTTRYSDVPGPEGEVMSASVTLRGMEFMLFNGGEVEGFTFSPATSFFVNCETQDDVDELWEKLSDGGTNQQCGWVTDKFGVTWQIVPTILGTLMNDPDAAKVKRVTDAMLQMPKLDGPALVAAANRA